MATAPHTFSRAFAEYKQNRHEVIEILHAAPSVNDQMGSRKKRELANALYRGSVVLLSSHLERYIESLIIESIDAINEASPPIGRIPESLMLALIEPPLRSASETKDFGKKLAKIQEFVHDHEWHWNGSATCGRLNGDLLVSGFDNPLPKRIREAFFPLGLADVVGHAVGRDTSPLRGLIEGKVRELVEKRNSVAHAGMTVDLTREDVVTYIICSRRLARGIDVTVGFAMSAIVGTWPWK